MARPPGTRTGKTRSANERLVIRPARFEDREAIFEMSEKIWGGTDYLPLVWDRWLDDPNGGLLTVTLRGKPVGVTKISVIAPGEIWLEGLRLHPKLHGQGLTKQINNYTFREVMKLNPKSVRYSTGVGNAASRHIGEERGFWLVARSRWMWGRARKQGSPTGRPARTDELDDIARFITTTQCYEAAGGLYGRGWKFPELSRRRIRELISNKRVLRYPNRGKVTAVAVYDIGHIDDDVCLGFLDGPDRQAIELAQDVLLTAGEHGHKYATAMLPEGRIANLALKAGFNLTEPARAVVYEMGARGFADGIESFEEAMWRALYSVEAQAAERLTDLLFERAPGKLARQNVRDFVMRNVLPDSQESIYGKLETLTDRLATYRLRNIARAILEHFIVRHGMGGDFVRIGKTTLSLYYAGKKVASMRFQARSFDLTLGPGAGPCFPKEFAPPVEAVRFEDKHYDPDTGFYNAVTLRVSQEKHKRGAKKAIDLVMRYAKRRG